VIDELARPLKGDSRQSADGSTLARARIRLFGGLAVLALISGAAQAASFVDNPSLNDSQRYQRCLDLVRNDPDTAYEDALAWIDAGGGAAADHCSALALIQSKHYPQAAYKLDVLARSPNGGDAELRSQLLDQAGNAWLLAGQPENALASFGAAMKLAGETADLLADRARAKGLLKNWSGAEVDLNKAVSRDQYRADLLVLRASARHALGNRTGARADIDAALDLDPHYADALVERGAMKLESGDKSGARSDWQVVLATQPKSPAADTARMRIEQLEFSGSGPAEPTRRPTTRSGQKSPSRPVHAAMPGD
jgi:tetratricopeptide (TPR) repeat protein